MIRQQISDDLKQAMKSRQPVKLETVRFVWSEIKNAEIDAKRELNEEEVVKLLRTEVKRRREAIEQFGRGGRADLTKEEEEKLRYIEVYLPPKMDEAEVRACVTAAIEAEGKDFGKIMGRVMRELKGGAEGAEVGRMVKEMLMEDE